MDLIDKDAAMNIFAVDLAEKDRQVSYHGFCIDAAIAIGSLPSAERWIPVSERLPEMDGWYQCTVSVGKQQRYTMDLYFRCSNKRWIDYRRLSYYQMYELWGYGKSNIKHKITYEELDDIDRTEDVVAWTNLSEPYKESENE